jgi:DNA-binding NarL/FixJ family response regulator
LINILIADDHAFFADGVKQALKDTEINVIKYIPSADQIIDEFTNIKPDLLLSDIKFGHELNGFDVLEQLIAIHPSAKVILLSQFDQGETIKESYKRGAKAFLSKSTSSEELIEAIRVVAKGELYFTAENAIRLAKSEYDKDPDDASNIKELLTKLNLKEHEVFLLLAKGLSDEKAAATLDVSRKTITNYKSAIKEKLKINTVTEMTIIASKAGLVRLRDMPE